METSSHMLLASEFDSRKVGEMTLAQRLLSSLPDNSLTLFDKGYYSLGLLHQWSQKGEQTHWMLPERKDLQYTVKRQPNENDAVVVLKRTPQARKKFADLPETLEARQTSYQLDGKTAGYKAL